MTGRFKLQTLIVFSAPAVFNDKVLLLKTRHVITVNPPPYLTPPVHNRCCPCNPCSIISSYLDTCVYLQLRWVPAHGFAVTQILFTLIYVVCAGQSGFSRMLLLNEATLLKNKQTKHWVILFFACYLSENEWIMAKYNSGNSSWKSTLHPNWGTFLPMRLARFPYFGLTVFSATFRLALFYQFVFCTSFVFWFLVASLWLLKCVILWLRYSIYAV